MSWLAMPFDLVSGRSGLNYTMTTTQSNTVV